MTDGYRTDALDLGRHAATLHDFAARLDTVSRAADTPLAADSYGMICGDLAATTNAAESRLRSAIGALARVAGSNADGVHGCAADYQDLENQVAGMFGAGR